VPAALFTGLACVRRYLYDAGWWPASHLTVPVISVGNITTGGTGKTPFVAYLARSLQQAGRRPGILSRGYRAPKAQGARQAPRESDEALLLAELLPDVPHITNPDRIAGGYQLEELGVDLVVLDDGFQHRRLARDLDLVLVDATRPWGLEGGPEALLPRGLLREPRSSLARAHAIVLTRVDAVSASALAELHSELDRSVPGVGRIETIHEPVGLRRGEQRLAPGALAGREVDLVSGLGHPDAFERSVEALGMRVREHRRFPDHHDYSAEELTGLGQGGAPVITSAKDLVKLRTVVGADGPELWSLDVELALRSGAGLLEALLERLPSSRGERERAALHEGLAG